MDIRAFRAWRAAPEWAAKIPSPPYDVVSEAEARAIAIREPSTFLRVIRPEIDLPAGCDPRSPEVYERGRVNLEAMLRDGRLRQDPAPAYYLCRLEVDGHRQTGVLALAAVEEYDSGRIVRHEWTRPDKEDDRVRHIDVVGAHTGAVLLAYRDDDRLDPAIAQWTDSHLAEVDFVAPDGVRHLLWRVDQPAEVQRFREGFLALDRAYIADGHHRAASSSRVAKLRRARTGRDGAHDRFVVAMFPASQLRILGYHRTLRDLAGIDPRDVPGRIEAAGFHVRRAGGPVEPSAPGRFGLRLAGLGWFELHADNRPEAARDPVGALDVTLLTDRVLRGVFGVGDPRSDPRLDFVGGKSGVQELERRVESGEAAAAFSFHPTRIEEVFQVADAGQIMPPKSTWFEPKVRSGWVVHRLDEPSESGAAGRR